jgi:hypothetical protein
MRIAQTRTRDLPGADRTSVITNAILLARRISELQRRRQALITQQEQLRAQLPDWAVEPLRLVGMTGEEIRNLVNDMSTAEAESGLEGSSGSWTPSTRKSMRWRACWWRPGRTRWKRSRPWPG